MTEALARHSVVAADGGQDDRDATIARLQAWVALARETIGARDAEIERLRTQLGGPAPAEHLCFHCEGERYELELREGPAPAVGDLVDGRPVLRVVPCACLSD